MKTEHGRGTGRTTALILDALSRAINASGEEVEFVDHHKMCQAKAKSMKTAISERCVSNGLLMIVRREGRRVFLRSTLPEFRTPEKL